MATLTFSRVKKLPISPPGKRVTVYMDGVYAGDLLSIKLSDSDPEDWFSTTKLTDNLTDNGIAIFGATLGDAKLACQAQAKFL